jgi:hypothetical protein
MFIHRQSLYLAVALAASPVVAQAQERTVDTVQYDFDEHQLHGDGVRPLGEVLQVRTRGARSSLIRVRDRFTAELYKSVQDL